MADTLAVLFLFSSVFSVSLSLEFNQIPYQDIGECNQFNETYNSVSLSCANCGDGTRVDNVTGQCTCQPGWVIRKSGHHVVCTKCKDGLEATWDGRNCIRCHVGGCGSCPSGHIRMERNIDGALLSRVKCVKCASGTSPDARGITCLPCHQWPLDPDKSLNTNPNCGCVTKSGLCLPDNLDTGDVYRETSQQFQIPYSRSTSDSLYFRDNIKSAAFMCAKYFNSTACNNLANICSLTLHNKDHPSCSAIVNIATTTNNNNPRKVPVIFFPLGQTSSLLESESIQASHSLQGRGDQFSSRLNITVAKYNVDGAFLGVGLATGNVFHLCNISNLLADAAWIFGTRYEETCKMSAIDLFNVTTIFYDLYVPFKTKEGKSLVYSVPNRILNKERNEDDKDEKNWMLTDRFFLVDTVGGVRSRDQFPETVRYLSSLELKVTLVNTRESPDKPGMIHPPIAVLRYEEVTLDEAKDGAEVQMTFSVNYMMDMKESHKDVEISVGVLSVFAVLLAAIEAWSWSRRSGKLAVDLSSLVTLIFTAAGYLSYVFLCVIFFSSLYWFIFFKQQTFVHVVLPNEEQEKFIKHYLISAFALKLVNILFLIYSQISVDVFLLDWEKPPLVTSKSKESNEPPISVWRTYLVANEWNELQTRRKTHAGLQLILMILIMRVLGVENLATSDPHSHLWPEAGHYTAGHSYVCRLALGVAVWVGVAVIQTVFWVGLYTSVVEDKLAQFTDVCSISNISVFVMSHTNFGYYIHGKSPHGSADTDMAGLMGQLQREADDLCGHRGLQAGNDHQTFCMTLPYKLRAYYDKVVTPACQAGQRAEQGGGARTRLTGTVLENMVHAYTTMNTFLTRFLEHALRDLDYEVRDKMFLETILDIEFQEGLAAEKAVFYVDNGHSFDSVLLYGHEFSLTIFEVLVFCFTDLFTSDFLISALITYVITKLIAVVRYTLGKRNLATKTLIDKRFLI